MNSKNISNILLPRFEYLFVSGFSGGNSFNAMYVLRSLKLNRMYQLTTMEVDALVENVQLKSIEMSNNPLLQPLPWGIFSANLALSDLNFINNSAWTSLFPSQVPVRSIQNLQLSGIPFYCNCSLIWLWELYQQNSSDFHLDQVTCQSVSNSAKGHVPLQVSKYAYIFNCLNSLKCTSICCI